MTRRLPTLIASVLALVVIGIPLWMVLITSVKSRAAAEKPNLDLPTTWQPATNYAEAFTRGSLLEGLLNSALVVVPSTVLVLLFGAMASWVFARRRGRLVAVGYGVAICGLLLPPAVITTVLELRMLGLQGTRPGMIAVYTGMYLSTAVFFMTGFIRSLPIELEEAARIDGAGPLRVFWSVILPLLRPVMATATILITLYAWSDVFYAFFVLGGGPRGTLPLHLYQVANAQLYLNNWNLVFAFVVMMSLPLIVLFVVGQRRIVAGITSGAVK